MKGYLAAAVAIAFLAVGGWGMWQRGNAIQAIAERNDARADLKLVTAANRTLDDALAVERAAAERRDRIILGFTQELSRINATVAENTAAINDLEKSDEETRKYLGGSVPPALELQLNR